MCKLELNQIYLQLEHEIKHSCHSATSGFRQLVKEDARRIIIEIQPDIDNWIDQLNKREITCYELESLIKSKCTEPGFTGLISKYDPGDKFDCCKNTLSNIIAKAIVNTYLKVLFPHKSSSYKKKAFEYTWF
jgi:hypothetical protein